MATTEIEIPTSGREGARARSRWLAVSFVLLSAYLVVLIRTAWMCDDAYIMLRTCHNLAHGFGPNFNIAERVETYSNPLWMLIVSAFYLITNEAYYTTLALSLVASMAAAIVTCRIFVDRASSTALAMTVLTLSVAFVDYSTSGLENPLQHLLLASFLWVYLSGPPASNLAKLSLLAALAGTTRLDALAFYAAPLAFALCGGLTWARVRAVVLGFTPLIAWKAFALFYYGFPYPNTAYAKVLATGASLEHTLGEGVRYLVDSLENDPLTLAAVAAAMVGSLFVDRRRQLPLGLGLATSMAYFVWVGGDYMSGRFFSSVLLASAILLGHFVGRARPAVRAAALLAALALGFAAPHPTVLTGSDYEGPIGGIADVRGQFFHRTGWLSPTRSADRLRVKDEQGPLLIRFAGIGFSYFEAGPRVHAIELVGLTDPLLSRLPGLEERRAGHSRRSLPDGYPRSLQRGENLIEDPALHEYYETLRLVTRGSLLDWRRLPAIWSLNRGRAARRLAEYIERSHRESKTIDAAAVLEVREPGTPWHADGVIVFNDSGLIVRFPERQTAGSIEATLDPVDKYRISLLNGPAGKVVWQTPLGRRHLDVVRASGLVRYVVDVPPAAARKGFDAIRIDARGQDGIYALGHLRLSPD